ncbi:Crp/Fnr family transcriptional regulator [Flagellimonas nanhaiensis]|uniref:Crp/Fnr family transcriptional regulator n=1 Tax=Flagellimonas nanhaiensis TaxID=2292706 RepID=A0A371JTW8_9FLAO|nr:Crp/Fnr family transcriptional regulator [Allomuricauda nanhaiensis]RDY61245.1 Crp/Fnr family transcriptional regulator [Allomuricauda nanhaiensis]
MSEQLYTHLNKYISVEAHDFKKINSYFKPKRVLKKEIVLEAGEFCQHLYFVEKGCLQQYFITDKGTERTVQFAIENWWMTDFLSYQNKTRTDFYIQAVENTRLLVIDRQDQEQLLQEFPILERYFRMVYQIAYGSSLMKMKYLFNFSKEELYFHFTEHFPEFAQRVPQYLIASFLGLTPEYVSEIRAKKRS